MQSNRSLKMRNLVIIAVILPMILLFGCVSKKNIKIPLSDPLPHPKLAQMQSMSIEEKDGVIYFGQSKKYQKRGITVVSLKGDPYEMGYAYGALLKDEIIPAIREIIYWAKTYSFGTSRMENFVLDRAREVEQYIPEKYITELKGLAAGSGIDYEYIMAISTILETADSIMRNFCTSVAVKGQDGKLIRSRSSEYYSIMSNQNSSGMLYIYQPSQGYAFAFISGPLYMAVSTAMNETGLNLGTHSIYGSSNDWKGIPHWVLCRKIVENAASVEEVGEILKKAPRSHPAMLMVTDTQNARLYEFDSEKIGYKDMDEGRLILTNYTQAIRIGASYTCHRYDTASDFLDNNQSEIDVNKLIELNRSDSISLVGWYGSENVVSLHLAIFIPETLDFWIAVDPPPASRGRWVGFNLKKEIDGSGREPNPLIIPAGSGITIANRVNKIKINEKEPWTGKWKVESAYGLNGVWAMKQEGQIVKSTRDSSFDFKGKVQGNQLKGKLIYATGLYMPFIIEMPLERMSFNGSMFVYGRRYILKGKRNG